MSRKDKSNYKHMEKFPTLRYVTYYLQFPDGDVWWRQRPVSNDLDLELKNIIFGHKDSAWRDRARELWKHGDVWWTDLNGVEHRMKLEQHKKKDNWGRGAKQGLGEVRRALKTEIKS